MVTWYSILGNVVFSYILLSFLMFTIHKQDVIGCLINAVIRMNSGSNNRVKANPFKMLMVDPFPTSNGCSAVIKIMVTIINPSTMFKTLLA